MDTAQPDGTIAVREGEGFERERVAAYLRGQIAGLPAGKAGGAAVSIRRVQPDVPVADWQLGRGAAPPAPRAAAAEGAHDMVREARLLQRLHAVYPLAPNPYAICEDSGHPRCAFLRDGTPPRRCPGRRLPPGHPGDAGALPDISGVGRRDAGQAARRARHRAERLVERFWLPQRFPRREEQVRSPAGLAATTPRRRTTIPRSRRWYAGLRPTCPPALPRRSSTTISS